MRFRESACRPPWGTLSCWSTGSLAHALVREGLALPPEEQVRPADVKVDYVGSLQNAAVVISRIGQGEKRLVFVDSRSGSERLGAEASAVGCHDIRYP